MIKKIIKNILAFCLGVFITLLFIEVFLRSFGWYQNNRNLFTKISVKNKNEIRILSLGDSMTAFGQNPFYPEQLQNILTKSLPDKKITSFNEGLISASSKDILFNLEKNLDKYQPDIVTIMIGSNDFGSVKYEEYAGIKNTDFLSRLKFYKLYKFLLKNIQDELNKTALKINPNNYEANVYLGKVFLELGESDKGLIYLKKAIAINKNNFEAYLLLGEVWDDKVISFDENIWYLQQAIKINPSHPIPYVDLAKIYYMKQMNKDRFKALNQDLRLNSYSENNITNAINLLDKAIVLTENLTPITAQFLAELYKLQGNTKEAEKVFDLLIKSNKGLVQNYKKIVDILKKRGIILVAVQYPMRDISPLKRMLKDTDSFFVDNEKNFKEMVTKNGPNKYFVDQFAGDFGHLTVEGHRIVAENIANVILKQIIKVKK